MCGIGKKNKLKKNRQTDQWNRIEHTEIDTHK